MKMTRVLAISALALLMALSLSSCGGGADRSTCVSGIANLCDNLNPGSGTPSGSPSGTPALASLTLSLSDSSGAAISLISPDRMGTLQALVKDKTGAVVPHVAVTFITTDKTGVFAPSSGTALTDAGGLAHVGLAPGTQAGAYTVTANVSINGAAATGTVAYAVAFPTLSLSALSINPAILSAGGNASVSVTTLSGSAPYTPPLSVSFTSPCITAGKAAIGSPVLTQNGIATASYSDKGCGVADTITASTTLGGATVSNTGLLSVLPATAGSVKFVTATTTNIALKGTGGFGRQEFSTLTFQVFDNTGNPVAGKLVDFVFADLNPPSTLGVGGLTLFPSSATSAADGTVTTLVAAGTIPTSVRVVAKIDGSLITTLSNILVISTGVPDQKHFSIATATGNCEGRDFDQTCSILTATLGDHFGNPAPDGTAVNFTTESGVIDASCVTGSLPPPGATPAGQTTNSKVGPGSGTCSVLLRSSGMRTADERVTVLAYALGEEDFFDANGNNVCDNCNNTAGIEFTALNDKSPDIFRDDNEDLSWTAGEPCIGLNQNGTCSTAGDAQYNGVLRQPQVPSAQTLYVSNQLVQIFSGSVASINFIPATLTCAVGSTVDVQVIVTDKIGNIMPAGTVIAFNTIFGGGAVPGTVLPASITVNNVVLKVKESLLIPTYNVTVACLAGSGKLFATVTTPAKVETRANIPVN